MDIVKKEKNSVNEEIYKSCTYNFDGYSVIVEAEFSENASETLEAILLRLMVGDKKICKHEK